MTDTLNLRTDTFTFGPMQGSEGHDCMDTAKQLGGIQIYPTPMGEGDDSCYVGSDSTCRAYGGVGRDYEGAEGFMLTDEGVVFVDGDTTILICGKDKQL